MLYGLWSTSVVVDEQNGQLLSEHLRTDLATIVIPQSGTCS